MLGCGRVLFLVWFGLFGLVWSRCLAPFGLVCFGLCFVSWSCLGWFGAVVWSCFGLSLVWSVWFGNGLVVWPRLVWSVWFS